MANQHKVNTINPIESRLNFLGFDQGDSDSLRGFQPTLKVHLSAVVEGVTSTLHHHTIVAHFFPDEASRNRLKALWTQYISQMFAGTYDGRYQADRERIGRVHARIGL